MIIALFPNERKPESLTIAKEMREFLVGRGVQVVCNELHAATIGADSLNEVDPKKIDFRISLGGDGTILRIVHKYPDIEAPLLGINLGGLGFMADIPVHDIYPSLEDLLAGRYQVQKRLMMEGKSSKGDKCFAVNEIVIHRAQNPCLIEFAIYVDGLYLNTFSADGMILATPNGSTAYSLAAGGPILTPDLQAFVLTPICPHTISNRPIVLMPKHDIEIRYLNPYLPVEVSYDGISTFNLATHDTLIISPSKTCSFPLVSLKRHDYFSTLREKLGWQGTLKI